MTSRLRVLFVALVVGMLALAACGNGDGDGEKDAYVAAIRADILDTDEDAVAFSEDEADCLSEGIVDAVGVDTFEEAGVTADELAALEDDETLRDAGVELDEEQADEIGATLRDCIDITDLMLTSLEQQAGNPVPDDIRDCVRENIDEDAMIGFFQEAIVTKTPSDEDPRLVEQLLDLAQACPELATLFGG